MYMYSTYKPTCRLTARLGLHSVHSEPEGRDVHGCCLFAEI